MSAEDLIRTPDYRILAGSANGRAVYTVYMATAYTAVSHHACETAARAAIERYRQHDAGHARPYIEGSAVEPLRSNHPQTQ